jgi:hypothetical protein
MDESMKKVVSDAKHGSGVQFTFPYEPFLPTMMAGVPVFGRENDA